MSFYSFIGKIWLDGYSFPLKTFAVHRCGSDRFLSPPPSGSVDSFLIYDDVIVEGAKFIDDSGIFFIDDVLFSKFEFELIASVAF